MMRKSVGKQRDVCIVNKHRTKSFTMSWTRPVVTTSYHGNYGTIEIDHVDYSDKIIRSKLRELESSRDGYASIWSVVRGPPQDYRVEVLFCTLFCFFPTGLIALYFSNKVRHHYSNHDIMAAHRASTITKYLLTVTSLLGVVTWFTGVFVLIHFQEMKH